MWIHRDITVYLQVHVDNKYLSNKTLVFQIAILTHSMVKSEEDSMI